MCSCVKPCKTTLKRLHFQGMAFQIFLVDGCDFQLSSCAGFDVLGDVHHAVRVEIQSDNGIVAFRIRWFLFNAQAVSFSIKFRHSITLWVVDVIAKDGSGIVLGILNRFVQQFFKACATEDVVSKNQTCGVVSDKLLTDDECLCQSVRTRLLRVLEVDSQFAAVAQQSAESRQVVRCRYDEYVADARLHERRDRIINHRLVENRKQLLADSFCNRVEACA